MFKKIRNLIQFEEIWDLNVNLLQLPKNLGNQHHIWTRLTLEFIFYTMFMFELKFVDITAK